MNVRLRFKCAAGTGSEKSGGSLRVLVGLRSNRVVGCEGWTASEVALVGLQSSYIRRKFDGGCIPKWLEPEVFGTWNEMIKPRIEHADL